MFDQLLYEAWPSHGNAVGGRKQQRDRAEPDRVFAEEHLAIIKEPAARAGKKARAAPVQFSQPEIATSRRKHRTRTNIMKFATDVTRSRRGSRSRNVTAGRVRKNFM